MVGRKPAFPQSVVIKFIDEIIYTNDKGLKGKYFNHFIGLKTCFIG